MRALPLLLILPLALAAAPALADDPDDVWPTYGAHYGALAGGLAIMATAAAFDPPAHPRLGPDYDPLAPATPTPPDLAEGFAVDQRVSEAELGVALATGLSVATLVGVSDDDPRWAAHDAALGYAGALSTTLALTEIAKVTAGRLRPDYADRMAWCRAHPEAAGCASGHLARDGRKSFFSGHSATAFAAATFLAWQLGGRFVWRDGAGLGGRIGAGLGAAGLLGGAGLVGWSRLADGRHHPSDVITGGAVGALVATGWYLSLFRLDGARRHADAVGARAQTLMVSVGGGF